MEEEYGRNSIELEGHWKKIKRRDSLNLIEVRIILNQHGWLSPEEVSEDGNAALFLVIQHSNLKDQIKYLPMLRKAVLDGKASGQDLALLEDRVLLGQGESQIYGSQVYRNKDTGEYYVAPMINPSSVNDRRKEIGLIPIEDYLLHWNINWQIELAKLKDRY